MIASKLLIRADNARLRAAGTPRTVTGWKLVGSYYRNGRKYPGFTHLELNGGGYIYFPESVSLNVALNTADEDGYDTTETRAKLEHWTKTGIGVSFTLNR